jgi:hypothetical protein
MKIEITWNKLDNWWFELGISYVKTNFNNGRVFTLAFGFFSVYFRWTYKK